MCHTILISLGYKLLYVKSFEWFVSSSMTSLCVVNANKNLLPTLTEICFWEIWQANTQRTKANKQNFKKRTSLAEVANGKGVGKTERERKKRKRCSPTEAAAFLTILLPCLFTFSLVWTSMHGCSHHIYTCHPSAQSHKHSARTHTHTNRFLSLPALILRLSQYSPSSHILT